MKKASCVLIIVLLLLLEISAKAEWVSIVELRQQVDEMGRWIQNYTDTYGRQLEVDVLPMIPNVEVVPVLRVEPLDVVPDQIHPDMPLTTTNNEEGSGLGLLLCQDFAVKNGGHLWFESEEGKGSTFFFSVALKK